MNEGKRPRQGKEPLELRRLAAGRYFCRELGIVVARERDHHAGHPRWAALYATAEAKVSRGRSRRQAKLERVARGRWRTADGIEVRSVRGRVGGLANKVDRLYVDLEPDERQVPAVCVGWHISDARRFIGAIPWRGERGDAG